MGPRCAALLAAAVACAHAPVAAALSLRSAHGAAGGPPFGCCDAINKPLDREEYRLNVTVPGDPRFLVEWVGLEASGVVGHSQYEHEEAARKGLSYTGGTPSKCLTVGKDDMVGGFALGWATCRGGGRTASETKDGHLEDAGAAVVRAARRAAQEFTLTRDGRLKSSGGLCVRRMKATSRCNHGKKGMFYDLGKCDGPGMVSTFVVSRTMRNNPGELKFLGYPAKAVKEEHCNTCGPYIMQERCLSGGGPSQGAPGCPPDYHPQPGWTRLPATYVGDAAVEGKAAVHRERDAASMFTFNDEVQDAIIMSGFGETGEVGTCGSFVTDGPMQNSVVYLHRIQ